MTIGEIPDGLEVGDRIRMIHTDDPYTALVAGAEGSVTGGQTGDFPAIWVRWDSGSTMGLIPGRDRYELLTTKEREQ